jgi:hypothetical protein
MSARQLTCPSAEAAHAATSAGVEAGVEAEVEAEDEAKDEPEKAGGAGRPGSARPTGAVANEPSTAAAAVIVRILCGLMDHVIGTGAAGLEI